mgnify:CR=1 FL=1
MTKKNPYPLFFCVCFHSQSVRKLQKYNVDVEKADLEKLAKIIKICGILLQTKVYLFWKNSDTLV